MAEKWLRASWLMIFGAFESSQEVQSITVQNIVLDLPVHFSATFHNSLLRQKVKVPNPDFQKYRFLKKLNDGTKMAESSLIDNVWCGWEFARWITHCTSSFCCKASSPFCATFQNNEFRKRVRTRNPDCQRYRFMKNLNLGTKMAESFLIDYLHCVDL